MRRILNNASDSRITLSTNRRKRSRRLGFLVSLTLVFVCPQVALAQQSEGIEELYPMSDTILSIVFHPQVMIESAGDKELRDEFLQLATERMGVELGDIQNFTMRFGCDPSLGGSADSMFMFSMQSDGVFDLTEIQSLFFQHFSFEEQDHNGRSLYLATDGGDYGPCLCAPDGNSLLISIAPRIRALLDQQVEPADVSNFLVELEGTSDLCGYINFNHDKDRIRNVVENFFQGAPFATEEFFESVMKIESGYFNVHLSEDIVLDGTLETGSPENARSVAEELTKALAFFLEKVRESKNDMAHMPESMRESMEPATDAMMEILENATVTADGNQVHWRIEKTGGMASAWDKLILSMSKGLSPSR